MQSGSRRECWRVGLKRLTAIVSFLRAGDLQMTNALDSGLGLSSSYQRKPKRKLTSWHDFVVFCYGYDKEKSSLTILILPRLHESQMFWSTF